MTEQEFLKAAYDMQEYCLEMKGCIGCPFDEDGRCSMIPHVPYDWGISQEEDGTYTA